MPGSDPKPTTTQPSRRAVLVQLAGGLAAGVFATVLAPVRAIAEVIEKLELSEAEWKNRLKPAQFNVLRKEGTERPWTSPLNKEKRDGVYHCAGCDLELFMSETKFDSGTGWPSFYDVIPGRIGTRTDNKLWFQVRTEYHCARCGGHQGHVFNDGPPPTGLRYCNNGLALTFKPRENANG